MPTRIQGLERASASVNVDFVRCMMIVSSEPDSRRFRVGTIWSSHDGGWSGRCVAIMLNEPGRLGGERKEGSVFGWWVVGDPGRCGARSDVGRSERQREEM